MVLKLPKSVDYGLLILVTLHEAGEQWLSSAEIAKRTDLPSQHVAKLLKIFQRNQLIDSTRGPKGGYHLCPMGGMLNMAEVYQILEGPLMLTECSSQSDHDQCRITDGCRLKPHITILNEAIFSVLSTITIQMISEKQNLHFNIPTGV